MRELSLFSGAGGGLLGTKLLGWKHIGYVEYNDYCQKIISQRIKDGIFDEAPIFGDIRTFTSEGYARSYQGMVDVITAGFPCQPFSNAGKQQGEHDPRNMWPSTIKCIRIIRPRYALLENVPGLLTLGYVQRIFGDLAEAGYDAKWCVLGADDCGAPHRRKRLWIYCKANTSHSNSNSIGSYREKINKHGSVEPRNEQERISGQMGKILADTKIKGLEGQVSKRGTCSNGCTLQYAGRDWWSVEPNVGRVANGLASRVDRLKSLGNGQVPIVAATAWRILSGE